MKMHNDTAQTKQHRTGGASASSRAATCSASCRKCGNPGVFIRDRGFADGSGKVFMCNTDGCENHGLYFYPPSPRQNAEARQVAPGKKKREIATPPESGPDKRVLASSDGRMSSMTPNDQAQRPGTPDTGQT